MKLIGINGFKTSGKDTTYEIVKSFATDFDQGTQGRVERRAFADNLKIMAALALGYVGNDAELIDYMNQLKESGSVQSEILWPAAERARRRDILLPNGTSFSGREYLQLFGQHAREVFGDSFWVDQVVPLDNRRFEEIWRTYGRKGDIVGLPAIGCVTDVRYENEAVRVLDQGGVVWEVVRPGIESDGHSSEIPLPREYVTYQILNDSDLNGLEARVAKALETL